MSLTAVLAERPTAQRLVDYHNACADVNRYAYAITNTNMPVLKDPPANYASFATEFSPAKAHCLEWTNAIFPMLLALPSNIVNQADLFDMDSSDASRALAALVANPEDADARESLAGALADMLFTTSNEVAAVKGVIAALIQFFNDIADDTATLSKIAADALAAAGNDQQKIRDLTAHIDDLKKEVDKYSDHVTDDWKAIGATASLAILGVICCVFAPPVGVIVLVVVAALEINPVMNVVKDYRELHDAQRAVETARNSISDENQDVAALQALNIQFRWLVDANAKAMTAVNDVLDMWDQTDAELAKLQTDLTDANKDVSSTQYQQAQTELTKAAAAWSEIVASAQALAGLDYRWQDQQGKSHSFTDEPPPLNGSKVTVLGQEQREPV
jgi:hypothetical protein